MQMQNVEEIGFVYKRVRGKHKNLPFERMPAFKLPAANGSVLLKPLPAVRPQEAKVPRNDGSGQWSKLIVGMGRSACIGYPF